MQMLRQTLQRIDGKGYKAYHDLLGAHDMGGFRLIIDQVQADPYAGPSRLRALVPRSAAALPPWATDNEATARAARDFIARAFREASRDERALDIDAGAQSVLDRTAVLFNPQEIELRFTLDLPARGRSILGKAAAALLLRAVPEAVGAAALSRNLDLAALERHCQAVEDQVAMREALSGQGLVAFVADGAILPRRSGIDDRPLTEAIAFQAPESLRVSLQTRHSGSIRGMGVPGGITLVVGGGFHGKSTLLRAIECGVYDHIPGDGRERVVTDPGAVKIRAEDGRAVHAIDLRPFIASLPYGKRTDTFSTQMASGSTSQAAALQEALELGADTLLIDEDTSATNFMIRDQRMQALVAKTDEPITPMIDRIRQLRDNLSVSTVLVMGGSGDYFDHADTVVQMRDYLPREVTAEARAIAERHPTGRREEADSRLGRPLPRKLDTCSLSAETGRGKRRIKARGTDALTFGEQDIDLRAVEQIADPSQVRAIGVILAAATQAGEILDPPAKWFAAQLQKADWAALAPRPDGDLARPRLAEVLAALNRLRAVRFLPRR